MSRPIVQNTLLKCDKGTTETPIQITSLTASPSLLVDQGKTYLDYDALSDFEREIVVNDYVMMAKNEGSFEEYNEYLASNNNTESYEDMA